MASLAQTPMSSHLEAQAKAALAEVGMTLEEALDLFLRHIVDDHNFALELRAPTPETQAALDEFHRGEWTTCRSSAEMFALIEASE